MPPVGHTSASKEGTVRAVGTVVSVPAAPEPKPGLAQRALSPSPTVRQAPPGQASALPAQLDPRGCVARELTANVSKAHVRRRSADVSAPQAWPGPPSRSALLPSTALSSTRRTPAPGSSPTRQGLPGCRRPFCDARGRSREHAQKQAGVRGGTVRGQRHVEPTQALRADVRPATASCAGAAPDHTRRWIFSPVLFPEAVLCRRVVSSLSYDGKPVKRGDRRNAQLSWDWKLKF